MSNERSPLASSFGRPSAAGRSPFRFLRLPVVCLRTGLSRSQIYRLEALGKFPRRVKLSTSASAWVDGEVTEWQVDRVAASREVQP